MSALLSGNGRSLHLRSLLGMTARNSVLWEAIPFQDPIDELCAEPPPVFLRGVHWLVAALFVALLIVGGLTSVDVVVTAKGRLVTATPPIVLQPMDRAIIRTLSVRPGDLVKKGQILATLDPTFTQADTIALSKQEESLRAEVRRLEAEVNDITFDPEGERTADDILQLELFQQRKLEYAARIQAFDQDISRLRAGLRTLEDGQGALGRELDVARQVEDMRAALLRSQTGSKLNLLEAEAVRLRAQRDEQETSNRVRELTHSISAREDDRRAFIEARKRELLESLVSARNELARVSADFAKTKRLNDLVVLTAPTDGVVLDVAPRTEGSVVREAEPLFTIIPNDAPLIAEVMIASADVGYTNSGADVQIKIDAFPFQHFGMAAGRLLSVSEESFSTNGPSDPTGAAHGMAFHRGRVAMLETRLRRMSPDGRLFPGMTLTAEIKAGDRSVLSYFLYPLIRGLSESMREP